MNYLDDTSALIGLDRREQAADVTRALAKNSRVTLTPYHKYKSYGGGDTEVLIRCTLCYSLARDRLLIFHNFIRLVPVFSHTRPKYNCAVRFSTLGIR